MIYLKKFNLLSEEQEIALLTGEQRTYFHSQYPFRMFPEINFNKIEFAPVTIFYGGNGSGKSTLLNIISQRLNARKSTEYSKGEMFLKYTDNCTYTLDAKELMEIKMISSDDIFDYLFNIRRINGIGFNRREELAKEYYDHRYNSLTNFDEYDDLLKTIDAKKQTMSTFIKKRSPDFSIQEQSNGESALMFFMKEIKDNSIYILDEPENSMSASMQLKLVEFLQDSARFYNCQFIIATHSPFILSLKDAKIYDLDSNPVRVRPWTELDNVLVYYKFFQNHQKEFENN